MNLLKQKMKAYDIPQKIMEMGLYPYFRMIESEQDTVVKINGKDVMMFGIQFLSGSDQPPKLKEQPRPQLTNLAKQDAPVPGF
ncbi:MAG: hypothetical protein IPO65_17105 [Saprospiraceae bacterium]|nr:hypothetical protein [Saprospiraceae bacterium]